jgi:predicted component of type VI protein secretion system
MHSERVRKRVLRLRAHIRELKGRGKDTQSFETELSNLVTGKKPSRPVGATVGVKQVKRIK